MYLDRRQGNDANVRVTFSKSERTEGAYLGSLTPEYMLKIPGKKHFLISNLKKFSDLVPDDKTRKR